MVLRTPCKVGGHGPVGDDPGARDRARRRAALHRRGTDETDAASALTFLPKPEPGHDLIL